MANGGLPIAHRLVFHAAFGSASQALCDELRRLYRPS
jgi:hypothetical protein